VIMGLAGLALAWQAAAPVLGELATGVALVLGALALGVFAVLAGASLWRLRLHPEALQEDLRHPVRHAFVATVPVSLLLLATLLHTLGGSGLWLQALWWAGSLTQLWATLWVMGRCLQPLTGPAAQPGGLWPSVTPLLFIPVVGNVVAPLAGVGLGHDMWSAAQLGIGIAFWPVVLILTLVRRLVHSPVPDRLLPSAFIAVAPPSVIGLSLLPFGAPWPVVTAFWGVALFTLLWVGSQTGRTVQQPFGLAFWALSFPLAAFTTLTLKLSQAPGHSGLQTPATLALAVATLTVFALALATVRGLRNGSLLAPEPVATLVPAGST